MATVHPMTIMSLIFVVGLIPSITIVSGRLDLRAFGRDDDLVPYVFSCRGGRCGSLFMTDEADNTKPDDVDDEVVGHFPEIEDDRLMMTFPYCSTISVNACRSLVRRLERRRRQLLRRVNKRNVVVKGVDGTVVRLLGRRRRSAQRVDTSSEKAVERPKAIRSPSGYASFDASNRLLSQYREWRKQNGYGNSYARWGRSDQPTDRKEDGTARESSSDKDSVVTTNSSTTNNVDIHKRVPRSVVVEIESEEEIPDSERDMLDTYLAWRETHGYGTLAGRWG